MHSTKCEKSWYTLYIFFIADSLRVGGKVGDNATDEAEKCTYNEKEAKPGIGMAEKTFPDSTC